MIYKITDEQHFQVLADSFSISPSETGYELYFSANGIDFSPFTTVAADQNKQFVNMANGNYYYLSGNVGEVELNWSRDCGGGGGGTSAGVSSIDGQTGALTTKTINGNAILGSGDIVISGGSGDADAVILDYNSGTSLDTLFSEIKDAYSGGKKVYLRGLSNYNEDTVLGLIVADPSLESFSFTGTGVKGSDTSSIRTFAVSIWKYEGGSAGINGVQSGKFVPETIISNYQLLPASASWLGGVKVGSGLTIDGNGVLSVSGGSSDSNYVVVEALSAITNPVEGMIAYVPDKTVQYSNVQVITLSNTEGEGFDDYAGWINFNGVDVREIFQGGGGLKFYFDYGNSGKWMKLRGEYEGQQYTQLYRTHNDSQPSIEISAPLDLVGVDFTITPNTSHPSITTASTFNNFSLKEDGGIYRYEGSEWVRVSVPQVYNLSEMDSTARAALYNELLPYFAGNGSFVTRFPAENYRFFVNASDMSENYGAIPMSLSTYGSDDGNVLFFIGATAGKWAEPVYGFRASLAPDGNLETGKYEVRSYEGLPVQNVNYYDDGDNRLIFNTSTSAFTYGHSIAEGQPIVNGNTIGGSFLWFCLKAWDGNWAIGVPRLMFLLTDGNGSETYYTCPSIKTKFIPTVTIDGIDYNMEYTGHYGEVSVRFKVNDEGKAANFEFIQN